MQTNSLEKICTKCGKTYPIFGFYISKSNRDGHHNSCKLCMNQQNKEGQRRRKIEEHARNIDRQNFNMLFNLWKQLSGNEKEDVLYYLKLQVRKHLD